MKYGMRRHLGFLHPLDLLKLPGEGSHPKCERCRVQVNPGAIGHQSSKTCLNMHAAELQRKAVSDSAKALEAGSLRTVLSWSGWRCSNTWDG